MVISKEIGESIDRFKSYSDRLVVLFKAHKIEGIGDLIDAFRNNSNFAEEWKRIWRDVAIADGGKISLTTIGMILGAALGGVGIAAGGGAIGLPLVLVLGLGGLLAGTEWDASKASSEIMKWWDAKDLYLSLPKELYERIAAAARAGEIAEKDLIVKVLGEAFPVAEDLKPRNP